MAQEAGATIGQTAGKAAPNDPLKNLKFRNLGPAVGGGRVSAVVGIPGDPSVYYVGAAAGGVWKTIDGGLTWKAIFEKEPVASIGAIALAPSNPNLVWVGTGEANLRNDISTGKGVYFSPDGGATWKPMGLENVGQISKIVVDALDPNIVLVGALGHAWGPNPDRGVYRTADGGKTWQKVLFVNDTTGVSDLIADPGNPMVVFAGMWQVQRYPWELVSGGPGSGIYRSLDGGITWKKLSEGLPSGLLGRIGLAASASNPNRVYALIEAKTGMLWTTTDLGDHWSAVSSSHMLDVRPFYFSHLYVAPNDENRVYFLSYIIAESKDGGKTARVISRSVHPDHHTMWIDPRNPERMIEGNDGGVYVSSDAGEHWRYLDNIPIEQFYQVAASTETPYNLCGGLQDNDGWCGPSDSLGFAGIKASDWWVAVGGDGQYIVPAPSDPNIIYADSQNAFIERLDKRTGLSRQIRPYLLGVEQMAPSQLKYRFNWTSPIVVGEKDANEVYLGGNVLFKTTDGGSSWAAISPDLTRNVRQHEVSSGGPIDLDMSGAETSDTILSISVSPLDSNVIWVGTDDGLVQMTRDGGRHWANVTPPNVPEWGRVQQIEASPNSVDSCYVALDFHETDNNRPYVFKTHNYGSSWQEIDIGLPQTDPARVVREDPNRRGFLVVGTETGLFYSTDDGENWTRITSNFPTVPIYDIKFVKPEHDLIVATHGRGLFVLDDIRPLEEFKPAQSKALQAFAVAPAHKWHFWNRTGFSQSGFVAPNPMRGAVIAYWLPAELKPTPAQKKEHETPVKITVADAQGQTIRTLWGPSDMGFNRTSWNLDYTPAKRLNFIQPESGEEEFRGRGFGPPVAPGEFRVTIAAAGATQTENVTVTADPRFPANQAAFEAQSRAGLEVRSEVNALNDVLNRLNAMHKQLDSIETLLNSTGEEGSPAPEYAPVVDRAKALDKTLTGFEEEIFNTKVQRQAGEDDIHYLEDFQGKLQRLMYEAVGSYDQAPRPLVVQEMADMKQQLQAYLERFNSLLKTQVAAFNQFAMQHGSNTVFAGNPISISSAAGMPAGK